jgi:hypothetical protein
MRPTFTNPIPALEEGFAITGGTQSLDEPEVLRATIAYSYLDSSNPPILPCFYPVYLRYK